MITETNFSLDSTTKEGRLDILNMIIQSSPDMIGKKNEKICWDYYNNKVDPAKFDYLRKSGKYEYPAKIRRIPRQRPYIDNLVSQQSQRPFAFSVYSIDDESISKKYDRIVKGAIEMAENKAAQAYFAMTAQLGQLDQQRQQIFSMLQQQPQNEQQAQQVQQLQAQLPQINAQFDLIKYQMTRQQVVTKEDLDKHEQFYRYKYKDTSEIIAQKAARVLRQDLNIAYKETHGVKHRTVTGKEFYFVDYTPGAKLPTFDLLNGLKVFAPASDNASWTQDGPWVRIEEGLTYDQIISELGLYLDDEDVRDIQNMMPYYGTSDNGNFVATPNGAVLRDTVKGVYSGGGNTSDTYVVNKVWWRAPRIIKAKKSPNPFDRENPFTHFIPTDKTIIHEADYTYNPPTREWVSKDNPDVRYKAGQVETINKAKGEYIKQKTVWDRYKGFSINGQVVKAFKDPIQPRPLTDLAHVFLPVVGRMHNSTTDAPYSLIWNTIDLQETYDIIHYHRELLLALSGVAGVVMDISQKPEDMDPEEWYYQMKMGRFLIETVTKSGRKNFTFNQFPRIDMSLSSSIQYLDNMLQSVDETMGMVMGVTRQRLGQTVNTDQVGTFEMSRNLSMLTTEIIFREHDETIRQALTMCLNMAFRYCWDKGAMLQLVDDGIEYFSIPQEELARIEFYARIDNNTQESFNLDELRKVGMNMSMKGQVSFKEFVGIYTATSVKELEKKLEYLAKEAQELMDMRQNQQAEMQQGFQEKQQAFQKELQQIKIDSDANLKMIAEKMKSAEGAAKLELEKEALEFEKQKFEQEQRLAMTQAAANDQLGHRKIDADMEGNMVSEQVKLLTAKMNMLIESAKLSVDAQHNIKKLDVESRKVDVMDKKSTQTVN